MRKTEARYYDAHTHLSAGACDLLGLDLRNVDAASLLSSALAEAVARAKPRSWVRGWGWDGATAIAEERESSPVFIARRDGHAAWVNRAARAVLGLSPSQSVISDEAFDAARTKLPERSQEEKLAAIRQRIFELQLLAIVAIDDMVEPWGPEIYAHMRDRGELVVAVGLWLPESIPGSEATAIRRAFPGEHDRLALRGIKLFLDGTLGARTAALSEPYADDPGTAGALRIPESELDERVSRWTRRGFPVAIHALGDRAVTLALDVLERAPRSEMGPHRIEHAQVVQRSDLPRFAAAGIVASVQPGHWLDDRPWLAERLGHRPEVVVHPLGSLSRAGAKLVFGSDWPVSDWDPQRVLAAATDPRRSGEAVAAAAADAWYTSRPR